MKMTSIPNNAYRNDYTHMNTQRNGKWPGFRKPVVGRYKTGGMRHKRPPPRPAHHPPPPPHHVPFHDFRMKHPILFWIVIACISLFFVVIIAVIVYVVTRKKKNGSESFKSKKRKEGFLGTNSLDSEYDYVDSFIYSTLGDSFDTSKLISNEERDVAENEPIEETTAEGVVVDESVDDVVDDTVNESVDAVDEVETA